MFSPPWLMEGPPDSSTTRCLSGPAESARDVGTPGIALGRLWLAGWGPPRGSGALPWGCWLRAECAVDRIPSHPKTKTSSHELLRQVGKKTAGRGSSSPAPSSLRAEGGAGQPHVVPRPQLCSSNAYSPRRFSSPYRVPESRQPLARLLHILVSTVTSVLSTPRLPTFTAQHK